MPTTRSISISPSGGDYSSIVSAEAGEDDDGNLTANDEVVDFLVSGDWSSQGIDSRPVFSGWVTDETRHIRFRADSSNRPVGAVTSARYRCAGANDDYGVKVTYENIQFVGTTDLMFESNGPSWIDGCLIDHNPSAAAWAIYNGFSNLSVRNTILIGNTSNSTGFYLAGSTCRLHANTIVDCSVGITVDGGTVHAVSNIYSNNGTNVSGSLTTDTNNSAAAATFVDSGAGNYLLGSGDTNHAGNGTDLDGDTNLPVTVDILGDARPASAPARGASEPQATGFSLTGSASLAWNASGQLDTTADMTAAATMSWGATGQLAVETFDLAGAATIAWGTEAQLALLADMTGSASMGWQVTGQLATLADLSAAASIAWLAEGQLSSGGPVLVGVATIDWQSAGQLDLLSELTGAASLAWGATGQLDASADMAAAASLGWLATGQLATSAALTGAASVAWGAAGQLDLLAEITAAASVAWQASGQMAISGPAVLVGVVPVSWSATGQLAAVEIVIIVTPDEYFTLRAERTTFTLSSASDSFTLKGNTTRFRLRSS